MLRIHDHEDQPAEAGETALLLQGALTLQEVAERLGICPRLVQGHVDDGSLVVINVGRGDVRRSLRVLPDDLEGFVKRQRIAVKKVAPFPNALAGRTKTPSANPGYAERRAARLARRKP
ncbi:helix-turn-helix domain-containing protein [Methylobacterium sp. 1030]|uniref:helix-turn-helix domain-containing protein n=1 Tax=Methylobacterium sp. 1030 TaxID=3156404 RepID=UPI003394FDDB